MVSDEQSFWQWVVQHFIEILGSISAGVVSAWTWVNRRFAMVHARIDTQQKQLDEHATRLAVGERDFLHIKETLEGIQEAQREIRDILMGRKNHG